MSAKNFLARTQSPHQSAPYIVIVIRVSLETTWISVSGSRSKQLVPERFYWKVLDAFEAELLRLTAPGAPRASEATKSLITYIIGNHDFYKVISRLEQVEIQGFNLNGTLSVSKTRYPEHVIGIDRLNGGRYSKTVRFNRGFTFNFRIHSASSRVEPSLKFAVSAISLPPSEIYTNHITF